MNPTVLVMIVSLLLTPVAAATPAQDAKALAETGLQNAQPVLDAAGPVLDAAGTVIDAGMAVVYEVGEIVDAVRNFCETHAPIGDRGLQLDIPDGGVFDELKEKHFSGWQGLPCIKNFYLQPFCGDIAVPRDPAGDAFSTELSPGL